MGKKAEIISEEFACDHMNKIFVLIGVVGLPLIIAIIGCKQDDGPWIRPKPNIKITTWHETGDAGVKIEYRHHYVPTDGHGRPQGATYVTLDTPEEVAEYRDQLQKIVKELSLIEDKMSVIEQPTEPPIEEGIK